MRVCWGPSRSFSIRKTSRKHSIAPSLSSCIFKSLAISINTSATFSCSFPCSFLISRDCLRWSIASVGHSLPKRMPMFMRTFAVDSLLQSTFWWILRDSWKRKRDNSRSSFFKRIPPMLSRVLATSTWLVPLFNLKIRSASIKQFKASSCLPSASCTSPILCSEYAQSNASLPCFSLRVRRALTRYSRASVYILVFAYVLPRACRAEESSTLFSSQRFVFIRTASSKQIFAFS